MGSQKLKIKEAKYYNSGTSTSQTARRETAVITSHVTKGYGASGTLLLQDAVISRNLLLNQLTVSSSSLTDKLYAIKNYQLNR